MQKIKFDWVDVLIIALFVIVIYMVLTRIFGHSATDLAIMMGLFALLFMNQYKINREIGEIKTTMKRSFEKVKHEISLLKR